LDKSGRRYRLQPKLHEFKEGFGHSKSFCLWRGQIAVLSKLYQLNVWDTTNPLKLTRVKRRYVRDISPARPMTMKMDDKFIVVSAYDAADVYTTIFFFISSETLELKGKREISWDGVDVDRSFVYESGLLLVANATNTIPTIYRGFWGSIRMYDVASDTFIREIPVLLIPIFRFDLEHFVSFNSRFMILSSCLDNMTKSTLKIYDLEAIKNPESKEDGALIRSLQLDADPLPPLAVDDKRIVCSAVGGIQIFEFDS
jgi:hypothetical protein